MSIYDLNNNGTCYKHEEAFVLNGGFCYISEAGLNEVNQTDQEDIGGYTYINFLEIAEENQQYARALFDGVEWQSPETLHIENMMEYGSIAGYLSGEPDKE